MDIIISNACEKPIYEQLYDQIVSQIIAGDCRAGECLPSIRQVASDSGVSVITVKKAWEMLEQNGFIYTRAGKGCFVAEQNGGGLDGKKTQLALDKLRKDLEYYKSLNITPEELIALIKNECGEK